VQEFKAINIINITVIINLNYYPIAGNTKSLLNTRADFGLTRKCKTNLKKMQKCRNNGLMLAMFCGIMSVSFETDVISATYFIL